MSLVERVIEKMVRAAEIMPDNSGLYYGSPRPLMEVPGESVSSGSAYRKLKAMGILPIKNGTNGIWIIPPDIVQRYVS